MQGHNSFKKVADRIASNGAGVTIEVPGPSGVFYNEKGRTISFSMDHAFAADILFTYMVFLPKCPRWIETGEKLSLEELNRIKDNITEALKLFGAYALFIAPQDEDTTIQAPPGGPDHVH